MQINYKTVGKLKGYFITGSSIAASAITAHLAMNVIPGAVMGRAYQAAKVGAEAGLGPLAPYFATSINNTAHVASAEVYTKLKGTGYFGWTISAFTKASACGAFTGTVLATSLCKTLALAHTAYVKEDYQLSLSKGKFSYEEESGRDDDCVYISHAARIMYEQNHAQSQVVGALAAA